MRKFILILVLFVSTVGLSAQNRWSVYGGLNLSTDEDYAGHTTIRENVATTELCGAKYVPGGTFGVGYDINLKRNWSILPALEYSNTNLYSKKTLIVKDILEGKLLKQTETKLKSHLHSFAVPVLVNFRVAVDNNVKLRFGAGPYVQGVFAGKVAAWDGEKYKVNNLYKGNRKYQFTAGVKAEIAVETGDHLSYSLGFQRPFCDSVVPKTVTINAGVRYTF
ncbi:MAG: porin family protein [Bacilli bacterium]|jgi:hypothetical protein